MFPIPPGVHWKDVEAVRLPQERGLGILPERSSGASISKSGYSRKPSGETPKPRKPKPHQVAIVVGGRIKYIDRPGAIVSKEQGERNAPPVERAARKPKSPMGKLDPKYLVAARELRDRYLEQFNAERIVGIGKYDVARALPKQGPHADPLPVYDSTELVEVRAREKMPLPLPEAA